MENIMNNKMVDCTNINLQITNYLKSGFRRSVYFKNGVFYYDKGCRKPILSNKK